MYSEIQILANLEKNDIETAKKYLKSNILEKSLKDSSKPKNKTSVIKNVMKRAVSCKADVSEVYKSVHTYGNKFAFLDGYMIIIDDESYGMDVLPPEKSLKFDKIMNMMDVRDENKIDSVDMNHFNKFYPLLKSKLKTKDITNYDMLYVMYKDNKPYSVTTIERLKDLLDFMNGEDYILYQSAPNTPILAVSKGEIKCLLCSFNVKSIPELLEKQRSYYV